MKNYKAIVLAIVLIFAIAGLLADKVTDFKLEDIRGKQVWLSEIQKDGLVIIDFWATWCVPCKNSLPKMNEIHLKYDRVNVVTICIDKPRNKMEAKAFLKSNRFSFISLFDPQGNVMKMFNVTNIPRSFIIAPDGEILYDHTGYQRGDEKQYEKVIETWLRDQEETPRRMEQMVPDKEKLSKEVEKNADQPEMKKENRLEEKGIKAEQDK